MAAPRKSFDKKKCYRTITLDNKINEIMMRLKGVNWAGTINDLIIQYLKKIGEYK
jgi:hypothetical protein